MGRQGARRPMSKHVRCRTAWASRARGTDKNTADPVAFDLSPVAGPANNPAPAQFVLMERLDAASAIVTIASSLRAHVAHLRGHGPRSCEARGAVHRGLLHKCRKRKIGSLDAFKKGTIQALRRPSARRIIRRGRA